MSKPFYITTTLPYVNAEPHVGFATEIIRADIIARLHRLKGEEVFFNTGVDEHGQKIERKAEELGQTPQSYVDEWAKKFRDLITPLGISEDINFVRTTDSRHIEVVQEFWRLCDKNGFIYKKVYQVKYCVGCELEKTDSELEDGKCPLHPTYDLELRDEENYFFKFSSFQDKLLNFYEANPSFVLPAERYHEIKKFVEGGLQDFSISRLASKMSWGVPVPDEESSLPADRQVMYVWFDALVNYISVLGWPKDEARFKKWWLESGGVVQYCGKDNLRQQTAMWQAMLMAAGLPNSQKVIVEGFITGAGGVKMSKSLGNVINPLDVVAEYGTDALRYYVARELSTFEDSPFTLEIFKDAYNANLANGLGNLASRILTLSEKYLDQCPAIPEKTIPLDYFEFYENFDIKGATNYIWSKIQDLDKKIQDTEPFKVIKIDEEKGREMIKELVLDLYTIARMLNPVMPETSLKLKGLIKDNKKPENPLFLRKD